MRLSNLIVRLRRKRLAASGQTRERNHPVRPVLSLEAVSRAAQSRSLKGGMRGR
ncbi:hypothetical protein [Marinobacter sp. X15-166B]|uniref:hypothetical protein n=1 Tax=Marinobacter sp. X15-166B TaxID=1897620 RepID=UPI0013014918|nr:hypothetical protein [Marinobacter sp. X15-166B]